SERFQLLLIRVAARVTEEFEYTDDFAAAGDRDAQSPVEARLCDQRLFREVEFLGTVGNPDSLPAFQHPAGQRDTRGGSLCPREHFRLRILPLQTVPAMDPLKLPGLPVNGPEDSQVPLQVLAGGLQRT